MNENRDILASTLYGVGFAFSLGTGCWAFWGCMTPGDLFANGSPLVFPSLLVAVLIGLVAGYKLQAKLFCAAVWFALLLSLAFWLLVPDGWWAK